MPESHSALNVCLYSPGARRWAMTERAARHLQRDPHVLGIGPSRCEWAPGRLTFDIDEIALPWPRPVRGRVRIDTGSLSTWSTSLDAAGRHRWRPIAPCARVDVDMQQPGLRWQGHAYVDSNEGDEPLDRAFRTWDWLRAPLNDGSTAVIYDVRNRDNANRMIARQFWPDGTSAEIGMPPRQPLPASLLWRIPRQARSQEGAPPQVLQTLEDTPFYARSLVRTTLCDQPVAAVHETLDADRFASPWVQALLPWRMPRRW